jgi:hypothetical protein
VLEQFAMLLVLLGGGDPFQNGDAGSAAKPAVRAVRAASSGTIDARLTEPFWLDATRIRGFLQRDPHEGAAPSESTEVLLAYDDQALYVAARLLDHAPDSIVARLGRRDVATNSDLFTLYLDPYHDRRSGYFFGVNAAGTLYDGVLFNDDWEDHTWDGVWEGRAQIDEQGWVVEMRIPYSQLRFRRADVQVWGVNFRREIARKNEILFYAPRPKNASGFVSRFADLVGIERITLPRRVEVLPYATTRAAYVEHDFGDPFNDGSEYSPALGFDLRAGVGSNLTLNATVNPDFGQVEVDPAVVNLSDVETFFVEKRPFFIEGSSIFDFGFGGATNYWGFNWPGPAMLHTRRMGRAPQGETEDVDFSRRPDGVNILGALKLTGKLGDRWNIGTLGALTARERADLWNDGVVSHPEIEPLTSYGVLRLQREFPEGRQGVGAMATGTVRRFAEQQLRDQLVRDAFVGGVDGWTFLDRDKEWVVTGWAAGSQVRGNAAALRELQENSVHYFQRPDAPHVRLDTASTSLSGWAARFHLNKQKGDWFSNSGLGLISPGYESNDLGFMSRAGVINMHAGAGRAWRKPGKVFRYAELIGAIFQSSNWDGDLTGRGVWQSQYVQFLNYWTFNLSHAYNPSTWNDRRTRGGPLMPNDPGYEINVNLGSDARKQVMVTMFAGRYHQHAQDYDAWAGGEITFRPVANLSLSFGPSFNWNREPLQWVDTYDDPTAAGTYGKRYVFADLEYTDVSAAIRLNWTFTPKLSLQVYAQPLISSGAYRGFKALARPRSLAFDQYGAGGSTIVRTGSDYVLDADGSGPAPSYTLEVPDFSVHSLRGNSVLRWEYLPGSAIYLVWTQNREEEEEMGGFRLGRSMSRMMRSRPDNIFMIKISYWWNP